MAPSTPTTASDAQATGNTTIDSPSVDETWSLDALGNWVSQTVGGYTNTDATNGQNELTSATGSTQQFDNDGNTITGIVPGTGSSAGAATMTYNAWNEMVSADVGGATSGYSYDALGNRITFNIDGAAEHVQYYSAAGQVIETDVVGTGTASQYVWGPDYVNDLVEEDSVRTGGSLGASSSGLGQRIYAMTDANYDVTAVADATGSTLEDFIYDPYGARTTLNTSGGVITDTLGMAAGFQGGIADAVTGLVHFDARDYNPATERWETQDPTGANYLNGANLYGFCDDSPATGLDPSGLFDDPKTAPPEDQHESPVNAPDYPINDPVTLGDGTQGTITVGDDVAAPENFHFIVVRPNDDAQKTGCDVFGLIQFFKSTITYEAGVTHYPRRPTTYGFYNFDQWYVDNAKNKTINYAGISQVDGKSAAFADRPSMEERKGIIKSWTTEFWSILVKGKDMVPVWALHWKRDGYFDDKGVWQRKYKDIKSYTLSDGKLPDDFYNEKGLQGKTFERQYTTADGKEQVGDPISNPYLKPSTTQP